MVGYGTVRTYADHLGEDGPVSLLQTLDKEREADKLLTEPGVSSINAEAE